MSATEDELFWTSFLRSLKDRGLSGVQLVISDAHAGLKADRPGHAGRGMVALQVGEPQLAIPTSVYRSVTQVPLKAVRQERKAG